MPGLKPEDVEAQVNRDVLTIGGNTNETRDEAKGTWRVHERRFWKMYRSFKLPNPGEARPGGVNNAGRRS